jgi:hypothetical protein
MFLANTAIIIGAGEIGNAVAETLKSKSTKVIVKDIEPLPAGTSWEGPTAMHVCVRYSDTFIETVKNYIDEYHPRVTIVHSTVPLGTMEKLSVATNGPVYHAPVLGRHDRLVSALRTYKMFITGPANNLKGYFKSHRIKTKYCGKDWKITELAKLLCLYRLAVDVNTSRGIKSLCDKVGVDYNTINEFEINRNDGLRKIDDENMCRPVMKFMEGPIGGHCTLPALNLMNNMEVLNDTAIKASVEKILSWNQGVQVH